MKLTAYDLAPNKGAFVAAMIERSNKAQTRLKQGSNKAVPENKVIPDKQMLRDIKTLSNSQLCKKYGIGKSTATRLRTEFGTAVTRPEWTDTILINLYAQRTAGVSCAVLGKSIGVTDATIRKVLRDNKERIERLMQE